MPSLLEKKVGYICSIGTFCGSLMWDHTVPLSHEGTILSSLMCLFSVKGRKTSATQGRLAHPTHELCADLISCGGAPPAPSPCGTFCGLWPLPVNRISFKTPAIFSRSLAPPVLPEWSCASVMPERSSICQLPSYNKPEPQV